MALMNITEVNETMCRMSGYTREELIQTPFPDYFTDPKRAAAGVRLTLDGGAVTKGGNVQGVLASARDITDRVRLEEQLREQQTYLRGLIESSVEPDHGGSRRLHHRSHRAQALRTNLAGEER